MLKAILFDLDGTLITIKNTVFEENLFAAYSQIAIENKLDPKDLLKGLAAGYNAVNTNCSNKLNYTVFMQTFAQTCTCDYKKLEKIFDNFYLTKFNDFKNLLEKKLNFKDSFKKFRKAGYKLVLATNPTFQMQAIETRLKWIGLAPSDFDLITHYKNCKSAKRSPVAYYTSICKRIKVKPSEALMVGNNVQEDMSASLIGCQTYLIEDYILNDQKNPLSTNQFKKGTIEDFFKNFPNI